MKRTTLGRILVFSALVGSGAFAQPVPVQEPTAQSKPSDPKLLFVKADSTGAMGERLAECERLTIDKYKASGTRVTVTSDSEFKRWLETGGKEYSIAHKYFQQLAYARSLEADAIGGLFITEWTNDQGKRVFAGWGIALKACTPWQFVADEKQGDAVRAIPLFATKGDDNWALPMVVEQKPCGKNALHTVEKGEKAFLGISVDGSLVTSVSRESAAAEAGLSAGDRIITIDGKPVTDQDSLGKLLGPRKPGDQIRVEYERNGATANKTVRLMDYYEYEAKTALPGKPLPPLVSEGIDGREIKLADLKGKVVLLQFWATWCEPCKRQMPGLQLLCERGQDKGLVVVSISVDEDESAWKNFVRNNRLGGVQVRSPEWADALSIPGYPTNLLVDRRGVARCYLFSSDVAPATWALLDEK